MAENKDYKVIVDGLEDEDDDDDMEDLRVTLDIGDGKEIECGILTIFDLDDGSDQDYIVLVPVDEDDDDDMEDLRVTLDIGDGKEIECGILTIFDLDDGSDQDYIVLVPVDEDGDFIEQTDIYIYKYFEDENGEPSIEMLDDDAEYEKVTARFEELMDEADDDED